MTVLTFKYRLLPNKKQHATLAQILESQRQLYNAALEERIGYYRRTGFGLSLTDQYKSLTICRRDIPEMAALPSRLQRGTLNRLDMAYKGFYARLRKGLRAGPPRFRSASRFNSFEFVEFIGIRLDGRRIRILGVASGIRVHTHRALPQGKILGCTIKRERSGVWSICFIVNIAEPERREIATAVGIDMGIKTLAATSDGELIPNPRLARRAEGAMRRAQRALSRCRRGSKRREKVRNRAAKLHRKIANSRATNLHQISAGLIKKYDLVAIEALTIKNLARGKAALDIHDASWGRLSYFLRYKAERAGVHFVEVNPKFTSQDCACCGSRVPKALKDRWHCCPTCGIREDRDINAARVILSRAVAGPGALNVAGFGERAPGNIAAYGAGG